MRRGYEVVCERVLHALADLAMERIKDVAFLREQILGEACNIHILLETFALLTGRAILLF